MNYKELVFTIFSSEDYSRDLLINALSEVGFDTFEETPSGFKGYIAESNFSQARLEQALDGYRETISFTFENNDIPYKNWNEVWESNFEPLEISDQCYVRATFHQSRPEFKYEIVIDPKMAFGTGHHQTTSMMMKWMLEEDFKDKIILDMGSGTGILAILAAKLGATEIVAIDYDQLCYESTLENSALNDVGNISVSCGSKEVIPNRRFDIILANINRNILLDQMATYVGVLKEGGDIFFSGFYEGVDLDMIIQKAGQLGLTYQGHKTDLNWVAAKFSHNK